MLMFKYIIKNKNVIYKAPHKLRLSKKWWLIFIALAVFVIGLAILVLEITNVINLFHTSDDQDNQPNPSNTVDYSPATDGDDNISNQIKEDVGGDAADIQNLQVTLTQVVQDQTSRNLIVRALILGTTFGNCKLELIRSNSTLLTKEVSVLQQNNIATCAGFDISVAEFPSLGEFTLKLTVIVGTVSASDTYIINLEK